MTPTPPLIRFCAVAAPVFLLVYGLLRIVESSNGHRAHGFEWNLGHVFFFASIVLLGVLVIGGRRLIPSDTAARRITADVASVAALIGAACFLWVILGDLSTRLHSNAPLPDPLQAIGPALFQLGMLTLLIQLAAIPPRRIPPWSPVLVVLAFVAIASSLDLLPVAAILLAAGLAPLAVGRRVAAGSPITASVDS